MSETIIRKAFETRLKTWALSNSLTVANENVPYNQPSLPANYIACFLLPADSVSSTIDRRHVSYKGIFQISIYIPVGVGVGSAYSFADSLKTIFNAYTPLSQDSVTIYVTEPMSIGPTIQDSDFLHVPLSISYRADIIN